MNTNYYRMRAEVYSLVDKMASEGIDEDTITYKLTTQFGVSELFVKKRLQLLERVKNATQN